MQALIGLILLHLVLLHSFLHNMPSNWARYKNVGTNLAPPVASIVIRGVAELSAEYGLFASHYVHRSESEYCQVPVFGSNGQHILNYTVVPSPVTLPSMLYKHQQQAAVPNIFFERVSESDQFVVAECIRLMLGGETVGIIGFAGVGKSSLVNRLHMILLDEMMKSSSELKYMFVRIDGKLLQVSAVSDDTNVVQTVDVHHCKEAGNSFATHMKHIIEFKSQKKQRKRNIVLIAEFTEEELTSKLVSLEARDHFGRVFIAANDDIEFLVKFMQKAGDTNFYLVDRLTDEQAEKCCEIMYKEDPSSCEWGVDPDGSQLSAEEALSIVRERIQTVGPILRHIACSEDVYLARLQEACPADLALSTIGQMNVFFNPEPSSLLVSLSLRPHVTKPNSQYPYKQAAPEFYRSHREALSEREWNQACYQHTFLSEGAKARVLEALCSSSSGTEVERKLDLLERLELARPLEEFVVKHALCMREVDPVVSTHFAVDQWEFCTDPGRRVKLTTDIIMSPKRIEEVKKDLNTCVREERSVGNFVPKSVGEMEFGVLYSSSTGGMALGEYCFVNENRTILTYVHLNRPESSPPHPIAATSLHTILLSHGLGPGQAFHDSCKLRLVQVTNWNGAANQDVALQHTDSTHDASEQLDSPEWNVLRSERGKPDGGLSAGLEDTEPYPSEDMDWIVDKVERIIVRARTRPGVTLVPLEPKKKAARKAATRKAV